MKARPAARVISAVCAAVLGSLPSLTASFSTMPSWSLTRRRFGLALGLACLALAVVVPPAAAPRLGLPAGDVTMAVRMALMGLANLGLTLAQMGSATRVFGCWLAVTIPALLFVPGFPPALTPLGLLPLYWAVLGARSNGEAAVLGGCAAGCQVVGASGWIFHYFSQPELPTLIALAVVWALWAPLSAATRALVSCSRYWIPVAAGFIPLSEVVRGEWMNPPLPGLLMAHATADTALVRLAPYVHEAGIGFAVALLGLGGAVILRAQREVARARWARVAVPGLAVIAALAWIGPTPDRGGGDLTRVCSVQDPARLGGREAFGGGGVGAVFALADRARELGCEIIVFPEYSVELTPRQLVPADWSDGQPGPAMVVLAGGSVAHEQSREPRRWLRNVVCRLHLGEGRQLNCAGALDKLVFAPFGEAGLLQGVPALSHLGAWVSRQATGAKYTPLISLQPVGLLPVGGGRSAGVAICWEVLVPRIFERRGVPGRGSVDLLAVLSDLDGFGGSTAAIDHFRRAAKLHAVSLDAPLLFASTNGPFLLTAAGRLATPVNKDAYVTVWTIAL